MLLFLVKHIQDIEIIMNFLRGKDVEVDPIKLLLGRSQIYLNPVEARAKLAKNGKTFLLDVRQPFEYQSEHIQGAKLIPLTELKQRINELPKDRAILVVCRSGHRSMIATQQLLVAGYKAENIDGGMIAWNKAGLPVKKGNG